MWMGCGGDRTGGAMGDKGGLRGMGDGMGWDGMGWEKLAMTSNKEAVLECCLAGGIT